VLHEERTEYAAHIKEQQELTDAAFFTPEPRSIKQVRNLPPRIAQKWIEAMRRELIDLINHGTFSLTDRPAPGEQVIPLMWTFKAKINSKGYLDKCKARIVVRGDLERHVDSNTWSPTASMRLLKCFMADAVKNGRKVKQLDFIQAYLQAPAQTRTFVMIKPDVEDLFPEHSKCLGRPLRLIYSMYGMSVAGLLWAQECKNYLIQIGFQCSHVDPALFVRRRGSSCLKLILFVDDACYWGSSDEAEHEFERELKSKFNLNLLGLAHWYLGLRITHVDNDIILDQSLYARTIVAKIEKDNDDIEPRDTPLPNGFIASKQHCATLPTIQEEVKERYSKIHYRSVVGALIYLSNTRPDICFAISKLAKFSNNPGVYHYHALLWLVGYLKRTAYQGIRFYHDPLSSPLFKLLKEHRLADNIDKWKPITFSDASWQDCPDTGRSTTGRMHFMSGGCVEHGSHVPTPVAMSSAESEYLGCAKACMSAIHLRQLSYDLDNLGTADYNVDNSENEPPALIIVDSEAAMAMANSERTTSRTRHVSRRFFFVKQLVADNTALFRWVPSAANVADTATKSGEIQTFEPLWKIYLVPVPS
jgi:hypothetical protein